MTDDGIKERAAVVAAYFGPRVRELRERAGLTQKQFAERIGVRQSHVSQYESGLYAPTWETVLRVALACGVSVESLTRPPVAEKNPES